MKTNELIVLIEDKVSIKTLRAMIHPFSEGFAPAKSMDYQDIVNSKRRKGEIGCCYCSEMRVRIRFVLRKNGGLK